MNHPLLSVRGLEVRFGVTRVLDDVGFDLQAGETLGLVGESGSGKSTLARTILRLAPAAAGRILWSGEDMLTWSAARLRRHRRHMQLIFQDPLASLNPRMSVADAIAEPLRIFGTGLSARDRRERVDAMLERVGLSAAVADRYPHEFSGGQCQRIGIARAMILRPRLLICDEPVSSLDVSIQGQIVNLLADLQHEWGTAMLFISHNLAVVRHLSHRVLVLYRGRLVEIAEVDTLFKSPVHPYTRALLAAVPDPRRIAAGARTPGDAASVAAAPDDGLGRAEATRGCAFRARCPTAGSVCESVVPPLEALAPGHMVACHVTRTGSLVYP
jgi:oligopeptide transport system ATP-binding protein